MTTLIFRAGENPTQCSQIPLGIRAENEVTQVALDFSPWAEEFGAGVVQLLVRRDGDSSPYPVVLTQSGTTATWTVSATDLAKKGPLQAEFIYTVGTLVKKSEVLRFYVLPDIGAPGSAPDPYETWLETLTELAAQTQQVALDAAAAADNAASDAADAEAAAQAIQDMGVQAETLEPGSYATVDKIVDPDTGAVTLVFGIPRGQDGSGGGDERIFWATYATTTYTEIVDALNANKEVLLRIAISADDYIVARISEYDQPRGRIRFTGRDRDRTIYSVTVDSTNNWSPETSSMVRSVNGKTGLVTLTAADVGAGTYSKPSGGIPSTDLSSGVQASLGKADTAYQKPSGGIPAADLAPGVIPTVPSAYESNPAALGTASPGSSTSWARGDHVHDFNSDFVTALLQLASKVAYVDDDGETYYAALEAALTHRVLSSISAVFTQGANTVYTNDTLDSLKQYLVVTATYSDSSTETIPGTSYELSGALKEGTQTITVSYGGKTDTFTVTCTVNGWLYHFEQSLASSGSKDFGFSGSVTYGTGHDGTGYSMKNDPECISATGFTPADLSGDFTIAFWAKTAVNKNGQGFSPYKATGTTASLPGLATPANIKSGWTVTADYVQNGYSAIRVGCWANPGKLSTRIYNSGVTKGTNFLATPPSGFDSTAWHHFAWTRKGSTFRFFVDGSVIFTSTISDAIAFDDQCALGGWYDGAMPSTPSANKSWYDDLFVAEYCKWDDEFNASAITY